MVLEILPPELIYSVSSYLSSCDLFHLSLVSRYLSAVLSDSLYHRAPEPSHSQCALYWAVLSRNWRLAKLILERATGLKLRGIPDGLGSLKKVMDSGTRLCIRSLHNQDMETMGPAEYACKKPHNPLLRLTLIVSDKEPWAKNGLMPHSLQTLKSLHYKVHSQANIILSHIRSNYPHLESNAVNLALVSAIEQRSPKWTGYFLKHGADPDIDTRRPCDRVQPSFTPLMSLAYSGGRSYRLSKLGSILVQHGANISATNALGNTALHVAADAGNATMVQFLLKNGQNIEARNTHGETALHTVAGRLGYTASFLGRPGTARIWASKAKCCTRVLKVLLEFGARREVRDHWMNTAQDSFKLHGPKWHESRAGRRFKENVRRMLRPGNESNRL